MVQALGKLPLKLNQHRIGLFAFFSGLNCMHHKGIGMLRRAKDALHALLAGGGQEGSLRSGTENLASRRSVQ